MPPPELTTDAPILKPPHPVVISLGPTLGIKFHIPIGDAVAGLMLAGVFQEPLLRQAWLNRHIGTLTEANVIFVILRLEQRAHFLKFYGSGFAGLKTIQAGQIPAGEVVHFAIGRDHLNGFYAGALADLKVRLVVRRRHLQHAGAEFDIDVFIGHDRQMRLILYRQGPHSVFTNELAVARILRVYGDGRVARDGFWASSRNLKPRF